MPQYVGYGDKPKKKKPVKGKDMPMKKKDMGKMKKEHMSPRKKKKMM